ncbi:hypothetical protein [Streptomyces sp. NPDC002467]|uniref:hypothetical protein n=1 Tax=Streptomyces sp. NPDC002467 TaxID=3364647 RepID=UPI00367AF4F6
MGETTRKPPGGASPIGSAVCAVVLVLGHLATGYCGLLAYTIEPDGPWDTDAGAYSGFAAGTGLAFALVFALLTWVFVKAEWLTRRWFVVPAVLALALGVRLLAVLATA